MTYVAGLTSTLAEISQIQGELASLPSGAAGSGFDAVLEQISALSGLSGNNSSSGYGTSYGWPMEEGMTLPGGAEQDAGGEGAVGDPSSSAEAPSTTTFSGDYASSGPALGGAELASRFMPASTSDYASLAQPVSSSPGIVGGAAPTAGQGGIGQQAVTVAEGYLGVPYLWGGTNPAQGVDCSGLVQDVYQQLGIDLPRTSQEQATVGQAIPSLADAQPGDLVFYPGSDGTAASPGHVGIYIGNGEMIDAPHTGAVVRTDPVGDPTEIRRVTGLLTSGPAGGPYTTQFASAASTYGVPEQLLSAVASTESSFQPSAVSSAGAEGLMQLMPSTAASMGVNPFDPAQAIPAAAQLLSSYYSTYGSWPLALAAYNAGPGAVDQYGGIPPYPQTEAYVQTVLAKSGPEAQ
ncbi:MAG TPA: transglycosylase SLT domain-containing protein [Acidimicrobiales bacterium]|nr:transglycosylase SLT domain-containing protein [Acidimicrobiales bacterium]